MNKPLLLKVKAHILEMPERFIMGRWQLQGIPGADVESLNCSVDRQRKMPGCGTVACIAGWTVLLAHKKRAAMRYGFSKTAEELLGLREDDARKLFNVEHWSAHYRNLWIKTQSLSKRAAIAARVIDRFIRKHATD